MLHSCSFRAIWVLNDNGDVCFSKRYPTVERKCRQLSELAVRAADVDESQRRIVEYRPLPYDNDLAGEFTRAYVQRDKSDLEGAIRLTQTVPGTDAWVDDPFMSYLISLQFESPCEEEGGHDEGDEDGEQDDDDGGGEGAMSKPPITTFRLWPLLVHQKGAFYVVGAPLVEPRHVVRYDELCTRNDCGGGSVPHLTRGGRGGGKFTASISSLLVDLPSVTVGFALLHALGALASGEVGELEVPAQSAGAGGAGVAYTMAMASISINPLGGMFDSLAGMARTASKSAPAPSIGAAASGSAVGAASALGLGLGGGGGSGGGSALGGGGGTGGGGVLPPPRVLRHSDKEAVRSFLNSAMPFGSPLDLSAVTLAAVRLHGFTALADNVPGEQKQPAWKPYMFRGRQKISFKIVEILSASLYDRDDVSDLLTVAGRVDCRADVEGLPDVTFPLVFPAAAALQSLTVHHCAHRPETGHAINTANISGGGGGGGGGSDAPIVISFCPPLGNFELLRYRAEPRPRQSPPLPNQKPPPPPLQGFYQLQMVSPDEGAFLIRLELLKGAGGIKPAMVMEYCAFVISFPHRRVASLEGTPSLGTVTTTEHSVDWKIVIGGRTAIAKPLEVNMSGTIKFVPSSPQSTVGGGDGKLNGMQVDDEDDEDEDEEDNSDISDDDEENGDGGRRRREPWSKREWERTGGDAKLGGWADPFSRGLYDYAKASFKLTGAPFSGVSIDTKALSIFPPTTKVPIEVAVEVVSGEYVFWNSIGKCPFVQPMPKIFPAEPS
ncbi:hypothetical protein CBR_g19730 [Chara braunii]|uniref:MHD domain-containing protein n=1 Tax=Chara braunii TaxID=69332 RepID=A0A388JTV4_CHABU|nr:hypothetical protein CBR_g19730 [Chara braunii]|eukprot:GBG61197.1 hypothetical protein CBR_g19730 [Chara braunii]